MTISTRREESRETLFRLYDELNSLWLEAEKRLTEGHIPRSVCHVYAECELDWRGPNRGTISYCLGLQKVKGKWRICHSSYLAWCEPEPEGNDWTAIADCSAEIRVNAAEYLPGLEEEIVKSAEGFVPMVEKAIQTLQRSLNQKPSDQIRELLDERAKLNGRAG